MRKLMQKADWNKFRIRSRKDWVIFWVFAAVICYALGLHYAYKPDRWLFQFANPFMTDLNQPYVWGQMIVFLALLAAAAEAVLFLCRKPVKTKVLVLVGALLMPMVVLAGYRIHTDLIVSSLWKDEPGQVVVWKSADSGAGRETIILTGENRQEILTLCRNLTPISDKATVESLTQWYLDCDRIHMQENSIHMYFDKKFGHNYSLNLTIYDGKVFIWRGYSSSKSEITFFEDNGIVEWVEKIPVN